METLCNVSKTIEVYEKVSGAMINREKSVGLQLSAWRYKSMPSDSIIGCWTEGLDQMLGVWFAPDLQIENWTKVMNKMTGLVQTWSKWWLSLKGRAEVASVVITDCISNHLQPGHSALSRFLVDQAVKGQETSCETLYLLPNTFKGRVRDALAVDVQTCAEVEASLASPGW